MPPKRKAPRSQGRERRGAYLRKMRTKLVGAAAKITCPKCTAVMLPHHACAKCGYYRGREVIKQPDLLAAAESKTPTKKVKA